MHAEKYYRTVTEEVASNRPAFQWRQPVALARVTASAYGFSQQDQRDIALPAMRRRAVCSASEEATRSNRQVLPGGDEARVTGPPGQRLGTLRARPRRPWRTVRRRRSARRPSRCFP